MFIKTFKTSKVELIILIIGLVFFIATLWYIFSPKSGTQNTSANSTTSVTQFLVNAQTDADRINFLSQFGWDVEHDPLDVREIIIPASFDETYTEYNDMQKSLGFDLSNYSGSKVKKWVYSVKNYPGIANDVKATLLIANGKVIGGDISSSGGEKFTHSLLLPAERAKKEVSASQA